MLKGRSNYVCRSGCTRRADGGDGQLELDRGAAAVDPATRCGGWREWAETQPTRATGPSSTGSPSAGRGRRSASTAEECPGAHALPARRAVLRRGGPAAGPPRPTSSWSTPTSTACTSASGGAFLPEHDVVVIDEAHQLEDVVSDTAGFEVGAGRFAALARIVGRVVADERPHRPRSSDAGDALAGALAPHHGRRLPAPLPAAIADAARSRPAARVDEALAALRAITTDGGDVEPAQDPGPEGRRLASPTTSTPRSAVPDDHGGVGRRPADDPRLEVAPHRRRPGAGRARCGARCTAVLTSATIPRHLCPAGSACRPDGYDVLDVGSPFDYEANALLYCAAHLPDPRAAEFEPASHDELEALIDAAGGRTLALFTSWRAMNAAVDGAAAAAAVPHPHARPTSRSRRCSSAFADDDELVPVRHHGPLPGRRRARRRRSASSPSTGCRSPGPTTRCCRPGASGPAPAPSARSTCPGPPRCWPRPPGG